MKLKPQQEIDAAIERSHGKVTPERCEVIVATVRATRPEKMDELNAIFSEHLSTEEKAFYHDIVEGGAAAPAAPVAAAAEAPVITSHETEH